MPKTKAKKPRKPDRIKVGPLSAHPRKPPGARTPCWYWQVIYYDGNVQCPALGADGRPAHRRGSPTEIRTHLNQLLEQGGWKRAAKQLLVVEELTLDQLCRLWLASEKRRRDLGKISAQSYRNRLHWWKKQVSPGLGDLRLQEVTTARLQGWLDGLQQAGCGPRGRGYSPRSIRNYYRPIRSAWKWGARNGYTPHSLPDVELPRVDGYVYSHHTPSLVDAYAVIDQLEGWQRTATRLHLLTGARAGEVSALRWPAWDQAGRALTLTGKTGARTIPTSSELHRELLTWWVRCGQPTQGYVLGVPPSTSHGLWHALQVRANRCGVEAFSTQGLRRLASTRLIGAGPGVVPPREYEDLIGHTYEEGLRTYAQSTPQRLRAAADLLGTGSA